MGNCCSSCAWEFKKLFLLYSTDYEVLEYDTVQRRVKFQQQASYDSIGERNIRSDSNDPTITKFRYQAPFDVVGCVLEFVTDHEIFMTVVHCSHSLKLHIESQYPRCGRHVVFPFTNGKYLSKRSKPLPYVHQLKIMLGSCFSDSHFNFFPNLEMLIIWGGEQLKGTGLKRLNLHLQSLGIWGCKIPGHYFQRFSENLHTLDISNSKSVTEEVICSFQKLRKLALKKCYHIDDWKKICENSKFYTTTLESLEIREVKLTSDFFLPLNLRILKVSNCRSFNERMLTQLLERKKKKNEEEEEENEEEEEKEKENSLRSLTISNCQGINGSSFKRFERLEKLKLEWLDHVIDSPSTFEIPSLEKLKIQGCFGIKNHSIMNLNHLKRLTLIEEQQISEDAFINLGGLVELKLVQCTNISEHIFKYVKNNLKFLKVVGCEKISREKIEELQFFGIQIL